MTKITCLGCGMEFRIPPSRLGRRRFCSRSCQRDREALTMSLRPVFGSMKARCRCKTHKNYPIYGGVGIEVRFKSIGELADALGPRPGPEYTVDRIDNDGHYEAGNVRWATMREQNNNRKNSIWFSVDGVEKPLSYWSDVTGIHRQLLYHWHVTRPGFAEKVIELEVKSYSDS